MLTLSDQNFDKEIKEAQLPVLVDFFADWCEPCKMLAPILESVAKEMDGKIILAKANLDQAPETSQRFQVEKIPTVILFKQGQPVSGFMGLADANSIKEWLQKII